MGGLIKRHPRDQVHKMFLPAEEKDIDIPTQYRYATVNSSSFNFALGLGCLKNCVFMAPHVGV